MLVRVLPIKSRNMADSFRINFDTSGTHIPDWFMIPAIQIAEQKMALLSHVFATLNFFFFSQTKIQAIKRPNKQINDDPNKIVLT